MEGLKQTINKTLYAYMESLNDYINEEVYDEYMDEEIRHLYNNSLMYITDEEVIDIHFNNDLSIYLEMLNYIQKYIKNNNFEDIVKIHYNKESILNLFRFCYAMTIKPTYEDYKETHNYDDNEEDEEDEDEEVEVEDDEVEVEVEDDEVEDDE
jgi:hypothetical protein